MQNLYQGEGSRSTIIELGIICHKLFSNYRHPATTKEFQLEFWKKVAQELENYGY